MNNWKEMNSDTKKKSIASVEEQTILTSATDADRKSD